MFQLKFPQVHSAESNEKWSNKLRSALEHYLKINSKRSMATEAYLLQVVLQPNNGLN